MFTLLSLPILSENIIGNQYGKIHSELFCFMALIVTYNWFYSIASKKSFRLTAREWVQLTFPVLALLLLLQHILGDIF